MTMLVLLVVVGVALILAELVLPGGIIGIVGAICLISAVVLTFVNFGTTAGAIALVTVLVFSILMLALWAKLLQFIPIAGKVVLREVIADPSPKEQLAALVGQKGLTLTLVSPSGHAEFGSGKIDVISETGPIEKGKNVQIVGTRGPSILVEEISI